VVPHFLVLSLLSYDRLSKKPLLFKSFTGLTVQEFDNIYEREITKRYNNYEIQCLPSKRKDRGRAKDAGRPFKLDVKDRFLVLLVYYRTLYHLCIRWPFVRFWIKVISMGISRRLNG